MSISKFAFRIFSAHATKIEPMFSDLRRDLKRAGLKTSSVEYLSNALLYTFISFVIMMPTLSFIFSFFLHDPIFSFLTSMTISIFGSLGVFFIYINYPKTIIRDREKKLDNYLPFSALYLSTVVSSRLPLYKAFKIFSKFSGYEVVAREINRINEDVELFGLDINTALERAIARSPSRKFRELLYGILSVIRSGGDLHMYLKDRAREYMMDYRRKLAEFGHSMSIYTEIYLTAIILGAIFFTILTSVMAGVAPSSSQTVAIQFFLIFVFIPLVSFLFMYLTKKAEVGGE